LRALLSGLTIARQIAPKAALPEGRIVMPPFTAVFIAHVPDADPEKHRSVLQTDLYTLFSALVQNTDQALDVCQKLVAEEGVQSVLLCPGNSHQDVARIVETLGDGVSVSVARGDSRSMRVATQAMERAGWFSGQPGA
jgi:Family of unknown function (DUF6506)